MKKFVDYDLKPDIQKGIDFAGFHTCTAVQESVFDALFAGRDITVQSQTGTGKTASFLIGLFQLMDDSPKRVLILAPTRELVIQITEEGEMLGKFLEYTFCSIIGGASYEKQKNKLRQNPSFVVSTPGRLLDFFRDGSINPRSFDFLVIDEADRMLDMGFYPDMQRILRKMKPASERRTLLFSATLGTRVLNLAWKFMNNPLDIEIEPEHITVNSISQSLYHVSKTDKFPLLLGLIKEMQPESAIFFTNTKQMTEELSYRLNANNLSSEFIMGDLPQKRRLSIINSLKQKKLRFLVATDVAARGLHIDNLAIVFNYDLPEDPENYVHRIGRTARAGNAGSAISLVDEFSAYNLEAIERFINFKIPSKYYLPENLAQDLSKGLGHFGNSRNQQKRTNSNQHKGQSPGRRKPSRSKPKLAEDPRGRTRQNQKKSQRVSSRMDEQQRLMHYRQKYGENFSFQEEPVRRKSTSVSTTAINSNIQKKPKAEQSQNRPKTKQTIGSILRSIFQKK